jgi:phosphoglycolate phosphatase
MDSVAAIVACAQATLRDLGLEPGGAPGALPEARIRATIGLGLRETVEALRPGCDEELFASIVERFRHHWFVTYRDLPLLFEGVAEMLADLEDRGYLLAVATGKSRRGLDHALEKTGVVGRFHATRTADEAFSKPHPQMLLDVCAAVGVEPREALMIGDTTYDLEMARNAGAAGLGVLSGSHSWEDLAACSPVACLASVVELPAWLPEAATGGGAASWAPAGAASGRRPSTARPAPRERRPDRPAEAARRPLPRRALSRHRPPPT